MGKELNIAAILKEKPVDTKLWSPMFGEGSLDYVSKNDMGFNVSHHKSELQHFLSNGKLCEDGALCIFPSRNMRDWSKFAWKKGDVLTDNLTTICMFDGWANDDYTEFKAKYTLHLMVSNNAESEVCKTNNLVSVIKDEDKQSYLATAEKFFNVNLTKGSLKIEKPEFKEGDILFVEKDNLYPSCVFIYKDDEDNDDEDVCCYARFCYDRNEVDVYSAVTIENRNIRPATEEERQELFALLEKQGKKWDADNKQIEDLPTKCEFKAFDKVLVRDDESCVWNAAFFSHKYGKYFCSTDFRVWQQCIPYNDQTAHLLGTTDEWEGGEG